ncbi:MAG TPA: SCO family protein [Pyrinomonadaceae bacterium]|nr:SCO family protein [Pyrinomonadaceae bacterium]
MGYTSPIVRAAVVVLVALVCFAAPLRDRDFVNAQTRQKAQPKVVRKYSCPMHPEVTSTRRGRCPKCGMTLRLVQDKVESPATVDATPSGFPGVIIDTTADSSLQIPDVPVLDQSGKQLNFYSDLVKGKTVAINFIFTTCTTICPPLTATFRRVQQDLKAKSMEAQLISVSVDPTIDTPERLRDYAAKFRAEPGWTFVTGSKSEIDSLLQAFGVAVANKNDHTPTILIGNDAAKYWTRAYGLSSPTALIKTITEVADHK